MRHPNTMTVEQIEQHRAMFVGRANAKRVDVAGGVVFLSEANGAFYGTGFTGKAIKPAFHYRFRSESHRDTYVAEWVRGIEAKASARKERAEKRNNDKHGLMVGSVLCSVWGYEQTNVDWYQVIAVVSDKTVVIRKIGANITDDGAMSGFSTPAFDNFTGEPMRKRATSHGVSLTSFSNASVWDGKPRRFTSYA